MLLLDFLGISSLQATSIFALAVLTLCIRRRYFSPLGDIPGPFIASFTRLWHIKAILAGDQNLELIRRHDKHGLSFPTSHFRSPISDLPFPASIIHMYSSRPDMYICDIYDIT